MARQAQFHDALEAVIETWRKWRGTLQPPPEP